MVPSFYPSPAALAAPPTARELGPAGAHVALPRTIHGAGERGWLQPGRVLHRAALQSPHSGRLRPGGGGLLRLVRVPRNPTPACVFPPRSTEGGVQAMTEPRRMVLTVGVRANW